MYTGRTNVTKQTKTNEHEIISGNELLSKKTVKRGEKLKSDSSFLDKYKNYLLKVYPEELWSLDFYSVIQSDLRYPIINNNPSFDVERYVALIINCFSGVRDAYIDSEEKLKDRSVLEVAGIYKVCGKNQD